MTVTISLEYHKYILSIIIIFFTIIVFQKESYSIEYQEYKSNEIVKKYRRMFGKFRGVKWIYLTQKPKEDETVEVKQTNQEEDDSFIGETEASEPPEALDAGIIFS